MWYVKRFKTELEQETWVSANVHRFRIERLPSHQAGWRYLKKPFAVEYCK